MLCDTSFPPETAICLGQLIANPKSPAERLGSGPLEKGPQEKVVEGFEEHTTVSSTSHDHIHGGFSAAVLGFLPFRIGGNRGQLTVHRYEIQKVKQQLLLPSDEYIQQSVFQESVKGYLAKAFHKAAVYMIVGVKIGFGARILHRDQQTSGSHVSGMVPGAALSIPVDVGADISVSRSDFNYEEKIIAHPFVFAYRLRKIRYFKKTRIEHSKFTAGAQLHNLNRRRLPESHGEEAGMNDCGDVEIVVKGIADEDYGDEEDDEIKFVDGCCLVGHEKTNN